MKMAVSLVVVPQSAAEVSEVLVASINTAMIVEPDHGSSKHL
jgi:hypothetical protein